MAIFFSLYYLLPSEAQSVHLAIEKCVAFCNNGVFEEGR